MSSPYTPSKDHDHIYYNNGRWFFSDETEGMMGPFDTEELALEALNEYAFYLNLHGDLYQYQKVQ